MKPTIQAVRAIAARFALQVYIPVAAIITVVVVGLVVLSAWLTTDSPWWWALFVLVVLLGMIIGTILIIIWAIITALTPDQSTRLKRQVKAFVEKISQLSEVAQTPKFILLFRLVRDTMRPRENSYIASVSTATKTLRTDFTELVEAFRRQNDDTDFS
jgi:Na+/melibiose symporter-like transporter